MVRASGGRNSMLRTAIRMKVLTRTIKRMEWDSLSGKVVMSIRVAIRMTRGMVMVRCTGKMALVTKVNGRRVSNMESEGWSFQMEESKKGFSRTMSLKVRWRRHRCSS